MITVKIESKGPSDVQALLKVREQIGTYLGRRESEAYFLDGGRKVSVVDGTIVVSPGFSHLGTTLDLVVNGTNGRKVKIIADALAGFGEQYPVNVTLQTPAYQ